MEVASSKDVWGKEKTVAIVGMQFGDEGKGKIVDFLADNADIVVRYNGGANAGHTIVVGKDVFKFHLLPSGGPQGKEMIIANGMVIDPETLLKEIATLKKKGFTPKLSISDRTHVIMPHHKEIDVAREARIGKGKIGTTGKGIGPAFSDKARRSEALRVADFFRPNLKDKVKEIIGRKSDLLIHFGVVDKGGLKKYADRIADDYEGYANELKPYVKDVPFLISQELHKGKRILFEGAQGTMLDVDHGTFPFVTSSNSTVGGICTGAGVPPKHIGKVVGIAKAYTTRVGSGPFPTELKGKLGEEIRQAGDEFGTTTLRPRRCGWLDLVILRHACRINGIDSIVLTKLDVLTGIDRLNVCVGYKLNGRFTNLVPPLSEDVERVVTVYEELGGWELTEAGKKKIMKEGFKGMPLNMRRYIRFIEEELHVKVGIASFGKERNETLVLE